MPWTAITDEGLGALPPPRPHVWIAVSSVATVALAWALTSVAHASPPRNLMFTSGWYTEDWLPFQTPAVVWLVSNLPLATRSVARSRTTREYTVIDRS